MVIQTSIYFLSLFSIISIWVFDKKLFPFFILIFSLLAAFTNGVMDLSTLSFSIIYLAAAHLYYNGRVNSNLKGLLWMFVSIFALLLASNNLPGFYLTKLIDSETISFGAEQYTLFFGIDKIIAAFAIAIFGLTPIRSVHYFLVLLRKSYKTMLLGTFVIATFGILFGLANLEAKLPSIWLIWVFFNLLTNCITEEIIFRFFIQGSVYNFIKGFKYAAHTSIILASSIFMLYHSAYNTEYMIGVFIGSLFIGYSYYITKRVEIPIFFHSLINSIHFFFFTYPILSN